MAAPQSPLRTIDSSPLPSRLQGRDSRQRVSNLAKSACMRSRSALSTVPMVSQREATASSSHRAAFANASQDRTRGRGSRARRCQSFPCLRQSSDDRLATPARYQACDGPRLVRIGCRILQLFDLDMVGPGRIPAAEVLGAIHPVPRITGQAGFIAETQPFDGDRLEIGLIRQEANCLPGRPQLMEVISRVRAPRSPEVNQLRPPSAGTSRSLPSAAIFVSSAHLSSDSTAHSLTTSGTADASSRQPLAFPNATAASGLTQHFRQIPCTVKHAHDQRVDCVPACRRRRGGSLESKKADRWGRQMRLQGANPGMLADGGRQLVQAHAEAPGRNRILGCYPLDDFKDVSFGRGGQDRPGHRCAAPIAASARASTSSIVRVPLSSASSRVRAIMASNTRLRSSCSFRSRRPERTTSLTLL